MVFSPAETQYMLSLLVGVVVCVVLTNEKPCAAFNLPFPEGIHFRTLKFCILKPSQFLGVKMKRGKHGSPLLQLLSDT